MKRVFVIGSLLAAASFSPSLLATQPVQDASVDARLQVISTQLDKTNALLTKLVGEVPDHAASDKPHPDSELVRNLEDFNPNKQCASMGEEPKRYSEGSTVQVKGKNYKCVTGPHWQEQ